MRGTRRGFTTGACSAAAAQAALSSLLNGTFPKEIEIFLPNGTKTLFAVHHVHPTHSGYRATVIKDAGDDPDCTHGAKITAHVRLLPHTDGKIHILGGTGVGRVTRPGLGLPLHEAAITSIPRKNITDNLRNIAGTLLTHNSLEVTLSVPDGEAMALKTLNGRLGIVGGISILGTTGIVIPYSTTAYKESVRQLIRSAAAMHLKTIVLTTGRRTERYAMSNMPHLPKHAFIQMGDFVGAAMKTIADVSLSETLSGTSAISQVTVAVMVGKMAKIAMDMDNTHARKQELDMAWVANLAKNCGASHSIYQMIQTGTTVRYAASLMTSANLQECFYQTLAEKARNALNRRLTPGITVTLLVFDQNGRLLWRG